MKNILKYCRLSLLLCILAAACLIFSGVVSAQQKKNDPVLSEMYSESELKDILLSEDEWHPFPTADERTGWEKLPEGIRSAHIKRGKQLLDYEWPSLPAVRFLDFARNGNRSKYEALHFDRRNKLADLVIAECMEGKGRFTDDIANGVWAICEETYWGVPAHVSMQKMGSGLPDVEEPTVDLFAGETASLLAWTLYLVGDQLDDVSPLLRRRIRVEMERRIFTPCLEREDFWWMGFDGRTVNKYC